MKRLLLAWLAMLTGTGILYAQTQTPLPAIVVSACGAPTLTVNGRTFLTVDATGKLCITSVGASGTSSNFTTPFPSAGTAAGFKDSGGNMAAGNLDSSGNLKVDIAAGGTNAAVGATGGMVPGSADYLGVNISGNLTGVTGLSLTNAKAATVAVVDNNGNQITSFGSSTDTIGSTVALGSLNAAVSIAMAGQNSSVFTLASGTLAATLTPECSTDGGTSWPVTGYLISEGTGDPNGLGAGFSYGSSQTPLTLTNPNSQQTYILTALGSVSNCRVRASNYTSGTANATIRGTTTGATDNLIPLITSDGTTPPSRFVMVGSQENGGPTVIPLQSNSGGSVYIAQGPGTNWPVRISGNSGNAVDANGQNAVAPANEIVVGAQYNTAPTPLTSGHVSPLQIDQTGNLNVHVQSTIGGTATSNLATINGIPINLGPAIADNSLPVTIAWNQSPIPVTGLVKLLTSAGIALDDGNGNLNVNVKAGSAGNAASSATGSMIPLQADYCGVNVAGTLRGCTGVNPSGLIYAQQMDLASVNGTAFALGQAAGSGSIPTVGPPITFAAQPILAPGGTATDLQFTTRASLVVNPGVENFPVTQAPGYWNSNIEAVGGFPINLGPSPMAASLPVTIAWNQSPIPVSGLIKLVGSAGLTMDDGNGNLKVNVVSGSTGNAAAGNTNSTLPLQADYTGLNVAGTFRGATGVNPTGSVYAQQIDVASLDGTALGAPSNYGTSPGAVSVMGVNAFVTNTVTVSGTITANQGGSNWTTNVAQFGGANVVTGTGVSGSGIPRITVANDSNILSTQSGNWTMRTVGNGGAVLDANGQNVGAPANWLSVGCDFNTSPSTISSGNGSPLQCDNAGNLQADLQKIAGTVVSVNTGNADAGTARVVLANNNPTVTTTSADTASAGTTLNTACPTLSGCGAGSVVTLALAGQRSAAVEFESGNLTGATLYPMVSYDNQNHWSSTIFTQPGSGATNSSFNTLNNPLANNSAFGILIPGPGVTHVRVVLQAVTSGSTTATLHATASNTSSFLYAWSNSQSSLTSINAGDLGELLMGAHTNASAPSYTDGHDNGLSITTYGSLRSISTDGTHYMPTGDASARALHESLDLLNGNTISVSTGTTDTGTARVAIASNTSAIANWGQGATGSGVPSGAIYNGLNIAGTLQGMTGVNPSGSVYAGQVDLASLGGASLGLGPHPALTSIPVVPTQGSGYWASNVGAVGGLPLTLGPATMANALPVTVAWNQTAIPVALAPNMNAIANWGQGATGGAVPSGATYIGGQNSSGLSGHIICDKHAKDRSTTADVQLVAASGSTTIYVCGYTITGESTTGSDVNFRYADSAGCTTNPVDITPPVTVGTSTSGGMIAGKVVNSSFWNGLKTDATGKQVCVHRSAAQQSEVEFFYTQF